MDGPALTKGSTPGLNTPHSCATLLRHTPAPSHYRIAPDLSTPHQTSPKGVIVSHEIVRGILENRQSEVKYIDAAGERL
eukprot:scaffold197568_cov31-Tisochrysis_lutea.AAC.4